MKIQGVIKGIGNNESAIEEYSLISCEISQITEAFLESLHLNSDKINREDHYQLTGGTKKRITDNVGKLKEVMKDYDVTFHKTDSVFNIVSKHVSLEKAAEELLYIRNISKNISKEFCSEQLKGDKTIWDRVTKAKLTTHTVSKNNTKVKLQDHVIALKEYTKLMIRFTIVPRKRPELNLEKCIGQCEFSVVPKSYFTNDGKLYLESEKADLMHGIKEEMKQANASEINKEQAILKATVVFDGMAVVNKIKVGPAIQNCRHLAEVFKDCVG